MLSFKIPSKNDKNNSVRSFHCTSAKTHDGNAIKTERNRSKKKEKGRRIHVQLCK